MPLYQEPATSPTSSARRLKLLISKLIAAARCPDADQQQELAKAIKACTNAELAALGLQPPPAPDLHLACCTVSDATLSAQLHAVQSIISALQYNYAAGYNYNVSKKRPLPAILATAAGMLTQPLPIKCIEAVFLGLLMTQGWSHMQRLPVGFKSKGSNGQVYRHIVLAVHDSVGQQWGALGISRCSKLMDKPLAHSSLAELVNDYQDAYRRVGHELLKVRVGLPVEHDASYAGPVCWRYCTVATAKRPWQETAELLNEHAADSEQLQQRFRETVAAAAAAAASQLAPGSPRSPAVEPHITRPHSSLGMRSSTPTFRAPAAAAAASAAVASVAQQKHGTAGISSSAADQLSAGCRSPRRQGPGSNRCSASSTAALQPNTACSQSSPRCHPAPGRSPCSQQPLRQQAATHGPAGDTSGDEGMNDSDSEVSSIVAVMRRRH